MKNIEAQQHLEAIAKAIAQGDIRVGVAQIRDFQAVYKSVADLSVVEEAESDYRMMADYYRKGLADASRERIFRDIQKKLLQAYGDMAMDYQCRYNAVMAAVTARLAGKRVEVGQARRRLEEFVSDLAMLSLEPEDHTQEKSERLHAAHFDTLRNVFNHLFTSRMWTESDKQNWTALVLSPTIDLNDGLVMTSAIMLGCMMQFDLRKFRSLTEIYSYASDERLRQRALVGWLLAMSKQADVYPEQLPIVRRLLDDERCRSEVGEAQMQMFYCMDADKDSKEIQRDIMPGLIKNSNLRYSDRGFVEKEDDEMEDILHPDARDKAMEDMERGCQRMMDMQRRGSDIYFGGFAQMKRFSFFYSLVNWFMPFNTAHPDLRPVLHKLHNAKLLDAMVKGNPFCDSDKYSFVLALSGVIDRMPKNVQEMLELGDLRQDLSLAGDGRQNDPRYIRQTYLQDLYRFFRLFMQREELPRVFTANPLQGEVTQADDAAFFMDHPAFRLPEMDERKTVFMRFLTKRRMTVELQRVVDSMSDKTSTDYLLAAATALMANRDMLPKAAGFLKVLLQHDSRHATALRLLGKVYRELGAYEAAAGVYEKLVELFPDNRAHLFNFCLCLVETSDERARQQLFKLVYKYPEDSNVVRLLAWSHLCAGELEKAKTEYAKILQLDEAGRADYVNMGYCHWFGGDIDGAVEDFRHAVEKSSVEQVLGNLESDAELIARFVTSDVEVFLMRDLVRSVADA
ncbi:tetratricopeptide repeat protein [Segatella baroniae]|uniref:tetratricopeptide repeat protein n=1 Tax=Segatella baroniae TaxID=305719 RepID=UPI0028F07FBE|nr:tetratricopeptide repeat protein [Segatella baroniae]